MSNALLKDTSLQTATPPCVEMYQSTQDASINWVEKHPTVGLLESRYVRRISDYFVAYLSSQTGCKQACRMCHLTATGQTRSVDASVDEITNQARRVLDWYAKNVQKTDPAKVIHYNFMARGEPLNNKFICENAEDILGDLAKMAQNMNLLPRYLISTIMPKSFADKSLCETFPVHHPDIYYSIYSMDADFRKRWLPLAMAPELALEKLVDWQTHTAKIPKIHYAFIAGENDSAQNIIDICEAVNDLKLRVNVNIVRYNPADDKRGQESDEATIQRNMDIFAEKLPMSRFKLHPRVGFDVQASCGMFVDADHLDN